VRVAILGAALDTGNLGVQALGLSALCSLRQRLPRAQFTIFSGGRGVHERRITIAQPRGEIALRATDVSLSLSRDPFKPGNLRVEKVLARLGLADRLGQVNRAMREADLVLDFTGGDSFTSLYGPWRYEYATAPKRHALSLGCKLVLMPQTWGPFDERMLDEVTQIARRAELCVSRDQAGAEFLRTLLPSAQPLVVPDVAFVLPADARARQARPVDRHCIGLNVSGLLSADSLALGQRSPHLDTMERVATTLLGEPEEPHLVLIPHVVEHHRSREADAPACRLLAQRLSARWPGRVHLVGDPASAPAAKGLISTLDLLVGARMHACIAALSSTVPAVALAYSDKMRGVFATASVDDLVIDARAADAENIAWQARQAWRTRALLAARLRRSIPEVQARVNSFFDELAARLAPPAQRPMMERAA